MTEIENKNERWDILNWNFLKFKGMIAKMIKN
jgi:hypothetical protein